MFFTSMLATSPRRSVG